MKRPAILKLLYGLARATTEDLWTYLLSNLKAIDDGGKSERIADWMQTIKNEVNAMYFNSLGLCRFGDLLNNPCEVSNSTILSFREYPVVRMIKSILQEAIYKSVFLRLQQARKWIDGHQVYTDKALDQIKSDLALSNNFTVNLRSATETHISADVTCLSESLYTYSVTLAQEKEDGPSVYVCTCKLMWDTGRLCKHAISVFVKLNNINNIGSWNLWDTRWVILKEVYLVSAYFDQYNCRIPSVTVPHVPQVDARIQPWDIAPKVGRPKKRRMIAGEGSKRTCQACGRMGHYSNTCVQANTQKILTSTSDRRQPLSLGVGVVDLACDCDCE